MHESIVFCSACTMSSFRKFTFAISSPDEFLVATWRVFCVITHADGPECNALCLIFQLARRATDRQTSLRLFQLHLGRRDTTKCCFRFAVQTVPVVSSAADQMQFDGVLKVNLYSSLRLRVRLHSRTYSCSRAPKHTVLLNLPFAI